jgi:hypothetical protein
MRKTHRDSRHSGEHSPLNGAPPPRQQSSHRVERPEPGHLFERVVPSGMIVLDDYEWSGTYRPQKLAEDPWFEARGYRVMPLPTGQGLVFKR